MSETAFEDLTPPSLNTDTTEEAKPTPTPKVKKEKKLKAVKEPKAETEPVVKTPRKSKMADLYPEDSVITVLVEGNPKKAGSRAAQVFEFYKSGQTVGDFFAASAGVEIQNKDGSVRKYGGDYGDITYDVGHGYIKVG